MKKNTLIMVDLQNDFCPGGRLAVPDADLIIPLVNELQPFFHHVVATLDWHPKDHTSFASNHPGHQIGDVLIMDQIPQILWPDHCVQGSEGAQFHPNLNVQRVRKIFKKGIDKNIDSYSAFFDNAHRRATGLADYLHEQNIKEVYLLGLATDYCVKYSCIDAANLGFDVYVIVDACRGVELKPGDCAKAFQEMEQAGAHLITSKKIKETQSLKPTESSLW